MKVIVIGAGPAGITCAYELCKAGVEVKVFEASGAVGGLARSISLWNQTVDIGPHRFFSSDARVNRLWLEVVGQDYRMVDRLTRIYYRKRFFSYPLQPVNALINMGPVEAARSLLSYAREKISPQAPRDGATDTFEFWVVNRFGRRLFELFFKTYSEKLWGIGCDELDADFAAQRIKKFSLGEAIKSAFKLGNGKHKTLVDQFAYPLQGTGMVYERMAEYVRQRGGQVHLNCPVRRVRNTERKIEGIELENGDAIDADFVVSTMPLTLLAGRLGGVPESVQAAIDSLSYRNTILVYLLVDSPSLFPDQWLYIHAADLQVGRVTNFRNWAPSLYGNESNSILALEYWANAGDPLWKETEENLIALAEREMRSTGLLGQAAVTAGQVYRIPRCYPVYKRGYKEKLQVVVDYLHPFERLIPIGRYGAFKYNNQDHSILMGILAAENIVENRQNDLWSINTDYEAYQETAVITETGLVIGGG
ncbi:MAG: FAD-dependent oxidoreductase [Candidatus Hydrogenedentes bacterium]|nr:FAD-dependent oxidoreductase [Candidatus Hydrogenedentota bacterium]